MDNYSAEAIAAATGYAAATRPAVTDPAGRWARALESIEIATGSVRDIQVERTTPRLDVVTWTAVTVAGWVWSWADWQLEAEVAFGTKPTILITGNRDEIHEIGLNGKIDGRTYAMSRHADETVGKMVAIFCR